MKIAKTVATSLASAMFSIASTGCATYRTILEAGPGSPKVFSGARLDVNAITGSELGGRRFKVAAPPYPILDLPFSLLFDTLILPLTLPIATGELLFER